jgi:hypothetical protein
LTWKFRIDRFYRTDLDCATHDGECGNINNQSTAHLPVSCQTLGEYDITNTREEEEEAIFE